MATQITSPDRSDLTTELQSFLDPLTEEQYQEYFAKGVEKGESAQDWHQLRDQVSQYLDKEFEKLGKAYCRNDQGAVNASRLTIAMNTAMQLGFERHIQSQL